MRRNIKRGYRLINKKHLKDHSFFFKLLLNIKLQKIVVFDKLNYPSSKIV